LGKRQREAGLLKPAQGTYLVKIIYLEVDKGKADAFTDGIVS